MRIDLLKLPLLSFSYSFIFFWLNYWSQVLYFQYFIVMHGMSLVCVLQCTRKFNVVTSCHFHSFVHFRCKWHSHWPWLWYFFLFYSFSNNVGWMEWMSCLVLSCLVLSRLSNLVVFLVVDVDDWMCLECYWGMWDVCDVCVWFCVCWLYPVLF